MLFCCITEKRSIGLCGSSNGGALQPPQNLRCLWPNCILENQTLYQRMRFINADWWLERETTIGCYCCCCCSCYFSCWNSTVFILRIYRTKNPGSVDSFYREGSGIARVEVSESSFSVCGFVVVGARCSYPHRAPVFCVSVAGYRGASTDAVTTSLGCAAPVSTMTQYKII